MFDMIRRSLEFRRKPDTRPDTRSDTSKGYTVLIINNASGDTEWEDEVLTTNLDTLWWWMQTSVDDFISTVPKIQEYGTGGVSHGSADLKLIGEGQALFGGLEDSPSAFKQELACWSYLHGKVSRCIANYRQGIPAKPDTLLDTVVYAMMMRRLQETGSWP